MKREVRVKQGDYFLPISQNKNNEQLENLKSSHNISFSFFKILNRFARKKAKLFFSKTVLLLGSVKLSNLFVHHLSQSSSSQRFKDSIRQRYSVIFFSIAAFFVVSFEELFQNFLKRRQHTEGEIAAFTDKSKLIILLSVPFCSKKNARKFAFF